MSEEQRLRQKRRLAHRILVDGRLVAPLPPDRHGSISTYCNHGCRCDACRAEWAAYTTSCRKVRARQAEQAS